MLKCLYKTNEWNMWIYLQCWRLKELHVYVYVNMWKDDVSIRKEWPIRYVMFLKSENIHYIHNENTKIGKYFKCLACGCRIKAFSFKYCFQVIFISVVYYTFFKTCIKLRIHQEICNWRMKRGKFLYLKHQELIIIILTRCCH